LLEGSSQLINVDPRRTESVADVDPNDQPHVGGEQIARLCGRSSGANRTSQRIDVRLDAPEVGQHLDRRDRRRNSSANLEVGSNVLIEMLQRIFSVQNLLATAHGGNK
jgi:hypothetical protein